MFCISHSTQLKLVAGTPLFKEAQDGNLALDDFDGTGEDSLWSLAHWSDEIKAKKLDSKVREMRWKYGYCMSKLSGWLVLKV